MPRFRRTIVIALFLCGLLPACAHAQAFETAAIHPSTVRDGCTNIQPPGSSRLTMTCVPLRFLVEMAFRPDELEAPDSLNRMYDLQATTPNAAPWTMDSVQPMLQALLVERFHLSFHQQTKSVPGYELVVGAHGSRLQAAPAQVAEVKNSVSTSFVAAGRVMGRGLGMDAIASLLGLAQHAHVVDGTHLQGTFNVDLKYAPDDATASDLPQFSTAVKEQLGLELKRTSVPITVMVVDRADATPAEN